MVSILHSRLVIGPLLSQGINIFIYNSINDKERYFASSNAKDMWENCECLCCNKNNPHYHFLVVTYGEVQLF
jgi:hypothetical protein